MREPCLARVRPVADIPPPLHLIPYSEYNTPIPWEVEYTDEFGQWWQQLSEGQQDAVDARVELLMEYGPNLPFPFFLGHQKLASRSHA